MLKAPTLPKGYRFKVETLPRGSAAVYLQKYHWFFRWGTVEWDVADPKAKDVHRVMTALLNRYLLEPAGAGDFDGIYPPREDIG